MTNQPTYSATNVENLELLRSTSQQEYKTVVTYQTYCAAILPGESAKIFFGRDGTNKSYSIERLTRADVALGRAGQGHLPAIISFEYDPTYLRQDPSRYLAPEQMDTMGVVLAARVYDVVTAISNSFFHRVWNAMFNKFPPPIVVSRNYPVIKDIRTFNEEASKSPKYELANGIIGTDPSCSIVLSSLWRASRKHLHYSGLHENGRIGLQLTNMSENNFVTLMFDIQKEEDI